jgi:hypothetical protein
LLVKATGILYQAVEYIEWSRRVFVQLYLEDIIRKSDLNLGIMAEGQSERGFAETASAAQRGSNCCGLAALLVEEEMLDGVKDFGTRDVAHFPILLAWDAFD